MKKIRKYFRIAKIDVMVYRMSEPQDVRFPKVPYRLQSKKMPDGKSMFFMEDNGIFVHRSFVYRTLNVLKLIGKSGPAIGNCATSEDYRGQSIYPYVINHIASGLLAKNAIQEVFIIVNSDNLPSIRGIEKAGFDLFAKIRAKRFLLFYFDKHIEIA